MVGRILCIVFGLLALTLVVLLLLPVCLRLTYDRGDLAVWVRYGKIRIPLYPKENGTAAGEEKPAEKKKRAKTAKDAKKPMPNREQIFYSIEALPPILGRALRRVGQRIRIEPLQMHLLVAGADPADTAVLYGKLEAALYAGLPALERLVKIRERDVRLFLDFQQEQMDCIADVGVRIRPWDVLVIAVCAGGSLLKWLIRFRKLAAPSAEPDGTGSKDTNDTGSAA